MKTFLERVHKQPNSKKAKILTVARKIFGEYGFHGATTRMIAKESGIDVSTLYYHWGEKAYLYEAVVLDVNEDLKKKFFEIEKIIHGLPLAQRMELSIDIITDYLFEHPEITNVILSRYFVKIRHQASQDIHVPEYISNIAYSMGLSKKRKPVSQQFKMQVLAIMNTIHTFVSGTNSFCGSLNINKKDYIALAKETLRFILIPAFTNPQSKGD